MRAIVFQSFRNRDVPAWIDRCIDSVRAWAADVGAEYRFFGDEIFDRVPGWYMAKAGPYKQVATDLGRLALARELIDDGFELTVWLDADVLVFDPAGLRLPTASPHAFGRELWVQGQGRGLKVYRNVHNAVSVFAAGSPFLDFYIDSCLRIVDRVDGGVPPQIVGTKLLTALNNIVGLPLLDEVGMLSPLVVADLAAGGGPAVDRLRAEIKAPMRAANLCASLAGRCSDGVELTDAVLDAAVERLLISAGADLRPA